MSGELTPARGRDLAPFQPAVLPSGGGAGGWAPPSDSGPEPELDLVAAWGTVRRNWRVITLAALLGGLAGLGWASIARPVYRATATLAFEQRRTSLPALDALRDISAGDEVSTEMEVLRSRSLAEAVADSLGLRVSVSEPRHLARSRLLAGALVPRSVDSARIELIGASGKVVGRRLDQPGPPLEAVPGESLSMGPVVLRLAPTAGEVPRAVVLIESADATLRSFVTHLAISRPNREASIVQIEFEGPDPVSAADVVNTLATKYMARREEVRKTGDRSTVVFLRQQLDTLNRQLRSAEETLRRFRERYGVVSLEAEATTQVERLVELRARRAEVEAERESLERLLSDARAAAGPGESPFRRLLAFPTLFRSQTTASVLESLTRLENERGLLLARRTPEDPDVKSVEARIRETEARAEALVGTYLDGLRNQVRSLDAELAGFASVLDRVPSREVEFVRLQRSVQVLTGIYTTLQTRLKESEVAQAVMDASVQVVDRAHPPRLPIWPRRSLLVGLGLVGGLVLGVAFGFIRETFDTSVHALDDTQAVSGAPVLALIPKIGGTSRGRLVAGSGFSPSAVQGALPVARASADAAEAFRALRTNLLFATPDRSARVLVFTSAAPEEGKSTLVLNLALALAEQGSTVALVDADMRRGELHRELGVPRTPGLSEFLVGRSEPDEIRRSGLAGVDSRVVLIPTGTLPPQPTQLLGSSRYAALIARLAAEADYVLIDTPPVNLFTDAALAAMPSDGVVLVARADTTRRGELAFAVEQLRRLQLPVLGVVLNAVDRRRSTSYGGRYSAGEYSYDVRGAD